MNMFPKKLLAKAAAALAAAQAANVRIATAETCTAGLVSGCITSVSGCVLCLGRHWRLCR